LPRRSDLADITLRALAVLARADIVYCEDTRHSRVLLAHYSIAPTRPITSTMPSAASRVLTELAAGKSVAIISDAGTPLISDPGYKLVREAIAAGHPVFSLPGPSAVLAALATAGLATDAFLFAGFLPPRQKARQDRLAELKAVPATLVFFEAPSRLAGRLPTLAQCWAIARRRRTRAHQALRRSAAALPTSWRGGRQGEPGARWWCWSARRPRRRRRTRQSSSAQALLATMSLRDAARAVAEELNVARGRVYHLGLALKQNGEK
jgi:16S rRNA (cytidine1402-2'-O)-methyltransferase